MINNKRQIVLVINNVRSAHNVGAILRTADAFALDKVYICGYSPYPPASGDNRLPHLRQKMARAIHKSALGAEDSVAWQYMTDINGCLAQLRVKDYTIAALEQTKTALNLVNFKSPDKIALVIGNEIDGIDDAVLEQIKIHLQIPMLGQKESLNVASATAIALNHLRYSG